MQNTFTHPGRGGKAALRAAALLAAVLLLAGCAAPLPAGVGSARESEPPQETARSGTADGQETAGAGDEAQNEAPAGSGTESGPEAALPQILEQLAGARPKRPIDADFLQWCEEQLGEDFLPGLLAGLQSGGYRDDLFFSLCGQSLLVLHDLYQNAPAAAPNLHPTKAAAPVRLAFTGDVNLADDWENMLVMKNQPSGILDCISPTLLRRLQAADILLVNNEFCYSSRGGAMPGKLYTFRAAPGNVEILRQLGVDIVSLANNHVYDFGQDAFEDTLATLQRAGIPYVGAGQNVAEAMQPQYFLAGGMKIAYVAASRAEKHILTPAAEKNAPGVLRCYEPELFLQAVATARQNADVVIAYPHWGTENTTKLEDVQIELGRSLLNAGADAVIGAHPHVLQGIEFYEGKPVVYSLGNFWFNTDRVDTALLEVTVEAPGRLSLKLQPCLQTGGKTSLLHVTTQRQRLFDLMADISPGVEFLPDGSVRAMGN